MGPPKVAVPPQPRLQVSVIEARNVQADTYSAPDFYVKLKMGGNEFETDVVRGSLSPKFLKDVRLEVSNPDTDMLRMEMLQVGPSGDLILGSEKVAVKPLVQTGTLVQWFNLTDAAGTCAAELCLVLRYSSGEKTPKKGGRSRSPLKAGSRSASKEPELRAPSPLSGAAVQSRSKSKAKKRRGAKKSGTIVPLPLAIAGGILAGCVAFLWSKRPIYYEVEEGDTLCKIGLCFNRPHKELYQKNSKIITDPNVIYPGDRIRIV